MSLKENQDGAPAPLVEVPSFSLGDYLAEAGKAIRTTMPSKAWVEAIVLEAKSTRAGLSLELIEPFAEDQREARLRCLLWHKTKTIIETETGLPLDTGALKGAQARLLLKPVFHPRYHLEGEVLGLDPIMIESLVARKLEAIRRTLREENLYAHQRQLPCPIDVTSVAVVHPDRSAGWADVRDELERLQEKGVLALASYPVPFEGPRSAAGITDALVQIERSDPRPDLILIVRGGGAAAGLAALANLALARAICRCPIPIVVGIGHANDHTLLDELAWRSADTPSKALGVLKGILRQRVQTVAEDHRVIVESMQRLLSTTLRPLLDASRTALFEAAERVIGREASRTRETGHAIDRRIAAFRVEIDAMQADLDRTARELLATAPNVTRTTRQQATTLYSGILTTIRDKLPPEAIVTDDARHATGAIATFIDRQTSELRAALCVLVDAARRCLQDEGLRLTALSSSVQALDVTATLRRGFALPLDQNRRIIRTMKTARAVRRFDLLLNDGSVACRPVTD